MGRPTYSDDECTGTQFIAGTARGRRSWYVDHGGWLRGITYRQVWTPGENVAKCFVVKQKQPGTGLPALIPKRTGKYPWETGGFGFPEDPTQPAELLPWYESDGCDGLDPKCACGFYAYHSGRNSYGVSGPGLRVDGVIEGYGKVILGPAGYRAQKARVVALMLPSPSDAVKHRMALERSIQDLHQELEVPQPLVSNGTKTAALLALGAWAFVAHSPFFAVLASGALAMLAVAHEGYARDAFRESRKALADALVALDAELKKMPEDYGPLIEKVKANYPDVAFFENAEDLAEAFPVESLAYLSDDSEGRGTE